MSYFHNHHLYGLLFRSSSSFNIIRLVLLGVFSFSPAMYSLPATLAVIAGLLLVAFIWDYYFYAGYRPISVLEKLVTNLDHLYKGSVAEFKKTKRLENKKNTPVYIQQIQSFLGLETNFTDKILNIQVKKKINDTSLDWWKIVALLTDFLFIFGVLLSFYRGLQQCFHFSLSSNLLFYQIIAGLLVVSLILLYFRYRILKEEQWCLDTMIGIFIDYDSFDEEKALVKGFKDIEYKLGQERGSYWYLLAIFLLPPLVYGVFQMSIPGMTLMGDPHWLSLGAGGVIFVFFVCHMINFEIRKSIQRYANWLINFSFFYYTTQIFSTMALQTTFGALFYNPWGFLVLLLGGAVPATIVFFNEKYHEGETMRVECLAKMELPPKIRVEAFEHPSIKNLKITWNNDQEKYIITQENQNT
jgi:hypothetical protein